MATLRDQFHDINNQLNKITVKAGAAKELLKMKTKDNPLTKKDLDEHLKDLNILEQSAFRAAELLKALKDKIYSQVNPD